MMEHQRYVFGRDCYKCQSCGCDASHNARTVLLDSRGEAIVSNMVTSCEACAEDQNTRSRFREPFRRFPGRLTVVTGSMYAEKSRTTESLFLKYGVSHSAEEMFWVKPDTDNRGQDCTVTHCNRQIKAATLDSRRPDQQLYLMRGKKIVVIDEIQFFEERIIYVLHYLLRQGVTVIVNGLKLTADRSFFGMMPYILAEADEILHLKAVCNVCKTIDSATRTKSFQKQQSIKVGGQDSYYAICPSCDGSTREQEFLESRST